MQLVKRALIGTLYCVVGYCLIFGMLLLITGLLMGPPALLAAVMHFFVAATITLILYCRAACPGLFALATAAVFVGAGVAGLVVVAVYGV